MEVVVVAVAEHAWEENGNLTVCKMFDTIHFPALPFSMPRLSIALRILFEASEAGTHYLKVVFEDELENQIVKVDGEISITAPKEYGGRKYSYSFVINGQNVQFNYQGTHLVKVYVDDIHIAQIPVYVVEKAGEDIQLN